MKASVTICNKKFGFEYETSSDFIELIVFCVALIVPLVSLVSLAIICK